MAAFRQIIGYPARRMLASSLFVSLWAVPAPATDGHSVHNSSHSSGHPTASDVFGSGYTHRSHTGAITYNPTIFYGYGVAGPYVYSPPLIVVGPGGFAPFLGPVVPQGVPNGAGMGNGGLNLPGPPRGMFDPGPNLLPAPRRANPARSKELTEIGDRSFRAKNIKRAEEKYQLAVKANPTAPGPHVHLAQVSLVRGNYAAAADHLRDAVTVAGDGAWLVNAPDIQAMFGEPADFARQLARLETHLQANPNDRDGWFVLGAETYLSGRTRQAFDVFQRLTDRRTDEALTAFIDASKPRAPVPGAAN